MDSYHDTYCVSGDGQVIIQNNDVTSLCEMITSHPYERIVILSGAGVSTNAGIPDYRSEGGLYSSGISAERLFDAESIDSHPEAIKLAEQMRVAEYTDSHTLPVFLHALGILVCVITQNVDGLYQRAGLPDEKIVEFHGSMSSGNVVAYGGAIDPEVADRSLKAMESADMVIVMGTSLQVSPFCALPNLLHKSGCRVLVDLFPTGTFRNEWNLTPYQCRMRGQMIGSSMKFGSRHVTLRSKFGQKYNKKHRKWREQHVFESDCDLFSEALMRGIVKNMI